MNYPHKIIVKIQFGCLIGSFTHWIFNVHLEHIQSNQVDSWSSLGKLNYNSQKSIIREQTGPYVTWEWFRKYGHCSYKQWKKKKSEAHWVSLEKHHEEYKACTRSWFTGSIWIGYGCKKTFLKGKWCEYEYSLEWTGCGQCGYSQAHSGVMSDNAKHIDKFWNIWSKEPSKI